MCDNPVAPATAETAATIDSKSKAALANKFSFLANELQAATSTGTLAMVTNQETIQVMELSSGLSKWPFTNSLVH